MTLPGQATAADLYALVGRVFLPYNQRRQADAQSSGGRFVYYTTAETATRILSNREVWLRNATAMNDFSEISHGMTCLQAAYAGEAGRVINAAIDRNFPGLAGEIVTVFQEWQPALQLDTYLTCISEHRAKEDQRGRLSMWRAYGGRTGVAIVFNGTAIFGASNAIGAYSSPVFYGDAEAFAHEFRSVASNLEASLHSVEHLGREFVKNAVLQMLRFAALSTKHPSFEEELEWRVIACPTIHETPRLQKSIEVVRGTPQMVLKLPLRNAPEQNLVGLEPSELIDRIIIGPCQFPLVTHRAFYELLSALGVPDAIDRVIAADIPLRHDV
ncbi:MAG TPA: DUF2971 domain-containing protein [Gemmatimonadaceae bacterium]|jgi:hypothetical protein